ncbi:S8 family peptidase [Microbacterium hydrocarbonoxydans]|uniref:S8 family peptidase n=1 Tax=Microbacterium hydrocarbonoxydans TaxID=273678 RepID=UPI002041866A|nr:S8 family peptidase [Microbacterium hydrocarbonoxydans]MCM3778705.1 S8 family peptidase [Microbacterium hydrocarbonoxydans]
MSPLARKRRLSPRGLTATAAAFACLSLIMTPSFAGATADDPDDPEIVGAASPSAVEGEYLVVLKPQSALGAADDIASALTQTLGGEILDVFNTVLDGYSATLTESEALAIAADDRVDHVEQAQKVYALDEQVGPPSWGTDRVDQRDLPLDARFRYPDSAGSGVNVYIVDSGIRLTHAEFAGRIRPGFDAVTAGGNGADCNGHGTHVAGTAVGSTYGVAKKASVYPVRVLDCRGETVSTTILKGIEWVAENAVRPAVVNYSVGCRTACSIPSIDTAVKNLVASGVTWVSAAGNSNDDACRYSPQLVPETITVGNTTRVDAKAPSSSWGRCLDVWAPGSEIVSSWFTGDTEAATATGTSMASPQVAGAAALFLGADPAATPAQVHAAIIDNATPGKITGLDPASTNRLLFTGFLNGATPPGPTPVDLAAVADQSGTVGQPLSIATRATGGTAPYAFTATGLPDGLTIDASTGTISGTPTAAATSHVTVTVRDAGSPTTSDSMTFRIVVAEGAVTPPSTCAGTLVSSGSLTAGQQATSAAFTRVAGSLEVCLDGPDGADFDVYLQRNYSFLGWITVAQGTSMNPDEKFGYRATAGSYRLVVKADAGSGAFAATVK